MDWMALLKQVIEVCVIPLLGVLTGFLINFIRKKVEQIKDQSNNELMKKYADLVSDTIINCVIATNQTYVEALKEQDLFDAEAQKNAFNKTYAAVLEILTDDVKKYLNEVYGDVSEYLRNRIEAEVNYQK